VFLPVVYGQGPASVSKRIKISEKTAIGLIDRFNKTFPVAFNWVKQQQGNLDANNFAEDFFGRKRQFQEQQYRVRNFSIQAAASTICLYKLVKLFEISDDNAKIIFHIHDGYGMIIKKTELQKYIGKIIGVLEAPEEYYPGLKLKVTCKVGPKLDQLNNIKNL
jgi:DNA polymerase I-like protein with 3'-5' exonuclease and polymerase domains